MNHFQLRIYNRSTNECTRRNKHTPQSTHSYDTNIHAYSYIFTHAFKHIHIQFSHPTQMHTYSSILYVDSIFTHHTHIHTCRHSYHENMHMPCTPAPANKSRYHWKPFRKQYFILGNAPTRETFSQLRILQDSISISTR